MTIGRAFEIAREVHSFQKDKCGQPYISHPVRVAEQFHNGDQVVVALLHDVIEDARTQPGVFRSLCLQDLLELNEVQRSALAAITHLPGVPYARYIEVVAANPIALRVKIADLEDNMLPWRVFAPEAEYKVLQYKYAAARERLQAA